MATSTVELSSEVSMMDARSTIGTPVRGGPWHQQTIAERATVRHGWAELLEIGEVGWDNQVYNWGTGLESVLERARRV